MGFKSMGFRSCINSCLANEQVCPVVCVWGRGNGLLSTKDLQEPISREADKIAEDNFLHC